MGEHVVHAGIPLYTPIHHHTPTESQDLLLKVEGSVVEGTSRPKGYATTSVFSQAYIYYYGLHILLLELV